MYNRKDIEPFWSKQEPKTFVIKCCNQQIQSRKKHNQILPTCLPNYYDSSHTEILGHMQFFFNQQLDANKHRHTKNVNKTVHFKCEWIINPCQWNSEFVIKSGKMEKIKRLTAKRPKYRRSGAKRSWAMRSGRF